MKNINEIKSRLFTDDVLSLKTSNTNAGGFSYFNALAGDSIERKDIAKIYFTHLDRDQMRSLGVNSDSLPDGKTLPKSMLYFCGDLNKENAIYYSRDIRKLIALYPRTHKVGTDVSTDVIIFDLSDNLQVNNAEGNVSLTYSVTVTGAAKMLSQRMKDLITEDFKEYEYGEDYDFYKMSEITCGISFRVSVVEPKGKRVSFYDKAVRANLLILGFLQEFLQHHKEDANADAIEGFEDHSHMTQFLDYALIEFGDKQAQVNLFNFKGSDGLSINLLS